MKCIMTIDQKTVLRKCSCLTPPVCRFAKVDTMRRDLRLHLNKHNL